MTSFGLAFMLAAVFIGAPAGIWCAIWFEERRARKEAAKRPGPILVSLPLRRPLIPMGLSYHIKFVDKSNAPD